MRRTQVAVALIASITMAACGDQTRVPTAPSAAGQPVAMRKVQATPNINVTSTLYDADASGSLLLTRSDDYNAAGSASYTNVNSVSSHVSSDGSWILYLGSQSVRTAYLVLGGQGMTGIPDGYYWRNVEIYSRCFDQNNLQVSIVAMGAGASNGNCSFGVDFYSGSTKYKLAMSPNYAGTGRALVTCTAATTAGACTNWTIAPNANAVNTGVANLYAYANNGSLILRGVYRNSYSVTAAQ